MLGFCFRSNWRRKKWFQEHFQRHHRCQWSHRGVSLFPVIFVISGYFQAIFRSFLVIIGHFWQFLVIYGHFSSHFRSFVHFQVILGHYCPLLMFSSHLGSFFWSFRVNVGIFLCIYRSLLVIPVIFILIWKRIVIIEETWTDELIYNSPDFMIEVCAWVDISGTMPFIRMTLSRIESNGNGQADSLDKMWEGNSHHIMVVFTNFFRIIFWY